LRSPCRRPPPLLPLYQSLPFFWPAFSWPLFYLGGSHLTRGSSSPPLPLGVAQWQFGNFPFFFFSCPFFSPAFSFFPSRKTLSSFFGGFPVPFRLVSPTIFFSTGSVFFPPPQSCCKGDAGGVAPNLAALPPSFLRLFRASNCDPPPRGFFVFSPKGSPPFPH